MYEIIFAWIGVVFMTRREAREAAVELIFEQEFKKDQDTMVTIEIAAELRQKKYSGFAKSLFCNAWEKRDELDQKISEASEKWSIGRISRIALAVSRIATYEILYEEGIPASVSINEALELLKHFGDFDSVSFVNGLLGKIAAGANKE
jgi:N utilization substance protein B